jgi:hypothetical protein
LGNKKSFRGEVTTCGVIGVIEGEERGPIKDVLILIPRRGDVKEEEELLFDSLILREKDK